MKNAEQNLKISIIVAENAIPTRRELADWLADALTARDVEIHLEAKPANREDADEEHCEQSTADEGKPKTPLPDKEEPSSPEEPPVTHEESPDQEAGDDDWQPMDPEMSAKYEIAKERTRGFLIGMYTAWPLTGVGILLLRLTRFGLRWLAGLTGISVDVLIGLGMLVVLALILRRKTGKLTGHLVNWFNFDF